MAQRKPTEKTHKFLEITDPKKAVGLWSYRVVRETPMTPVGKTAHALGRFLNGDIVRWEHRARMAEALSAACDAAQGRGKREEGRVVKSPATIIAEYQEKAKQDEKRMSLAEWREKYAWLLAWSRYSCRLAAPNVVAAEKDVQMFFDAPSAGVNCHEGDLHSGRVFFLRTKLPVGLNADRLRDTQSFDRIGAATTARVESLSSVAPTPQLDSVEGSSHPKNASGSFFDSGVGSEATPLVANRFAAPCGGGYVVAGSENDLLSRSAQADSVQKTAYKYFVAVVLKPGGTKWWSQIDKTNVTWTDNVYDRLIIDPRGKLEWSPILAEVINEQVAEKNICLFMLEDDALFKAITDNELNPNEKYAHLCYAFDFFYRQGTGNREQGIGKKALIPNPQSPIPQFYLRWSAFINPKRSKFTLVSKQKPRVIEVMSERKKGWTSRQIEVKDRDWGLGIRDSGLGIGDWGLGIGDWGLGRGDSGNGARSVKKGNRSIKQLSREEAARRQTNDAKLGLGDTPLDRYAQEVARWVVENNGCAVLPIGASRELRLALSHALFFVTLPDRKPNEVGGILRGYQLPGRLVEHVTGKLRGDNLKVIKERVQKQSEEATARRRKMIVDCLFTRACTAVLMRNNGSVLERRSLRDTQSFDRIGAATTARVESSSTVAPTPQLDSVEGSSRPSDASGPFSDCGVAAQNKSTIPSAASLATSENGLLSRSAKADCVLKITKETIVPIMESIGARQIIEKAAWQRGFMEGNPLNLFKPGPMAGIGKLPDLSLALAFENLLGLKGETANATDLLVQTTPIRSLKESQGLIRESIAGVYPCRSTWSPSPGKDKGVVAYPADSVRVLRDEGRYYLMAIPKYGLYRYNRDLVFEPDQPGKKRSKSVPIYAYSFKSVGNVRSRSDSFVVEEVLDVNKVMQLARDGRIYLYSIDFGQDKWLADIVFSRENKQPCKIVPTIPILAPVEVEKKDALPEGRKSGTDVVTRVAVTSETAQAFITFTFNPTVARDNRKVEGRSWKSYCDAFPIEEKRHIVRWPDLNADRLRDTQSFDRIGAATTARVESSSSVAPTPQLDSVEGSSHQSQNAQLASLTEALQKVIETDGILLTDKEHIDGAIRAATYVVKDDPYNGYILKDRIFKDTDGRAEWRKNQVKVEGEGEEDRKKKAELNAKYEAQRKEQKGKPLCEVLSPDLAREAEIEFVRQIETDTLVDAKTPKDFKLDSPIKVTDDFKEAVAREFRRIAYTGTMGWRQKLNRPAHEVAVGIWLSRLAP